MSITKLTDYDLSTLTYAYDGELMTKMTDYHGNDTTYAYDGDGRMTGVTAPGSKTWTYSFDAYGRTTKVDIPNGMHTEYGYDTEGRMTTIAHKDGATVKQSFDYAFEDDGSITTITHEDDAYWAYEYDKRDRLTKAERYDDVPTLLHRYSYTYDDGDNMITKAVLDNGTSTTVTTAMIYNAANELTTTNDGTTTTTYTYDDWGRTLSKYAGAEGVDYDWGYGSKLLQYASTYAGEGTVDYEYGGDENRRSRDDGTDYTWYNWDQKRMIAEEAQGAGVGNGALTKAYFGSAEVSGATPSTGTYSYYTTDHLSSVRGVYDSTKTSTGSQEFDPFGDSYAGTMPSGIAPRYTVHQQDPTSGLFYAKYRYYSPTTSRWMKRDPLGMIDGPNVYAYVRSRPINMLDNSGLCGVDCAQQEVNCRKGCTRRYRSAQGRIAQEARACYFLVAGLCVSGCVLVCAATGPGFPVCYVACMKTCGGVGLAVCRAVKGRSLWYARQAWNSCLSGDSVN